MSASIFIKTWRNDLPWLRYCLQSIRKFGTGFDDPIIVLDESCRSLIRPSDFLSEKIHWVPDSPNGYITQQVVKLRAHEYTDSEFILFVDSDCIFNTPFSPESYMRDGNPVLLKTKYGNLGGAEAWKSITESFVGWSVEYEYMRRLPWMYRRDTLIAFRNAFPEIQSKLTQIKDRGFSEFNAIGAFIDRYEQDKYFISDTEEWMPDSVARQFWSWGQITSEIKREIEEMLK